MKCTRCEAVIEAGERYSFARNKVLCLVCWKLWHTELDALEARFFLKGDQDEDTDRAGQVENPEVLATGGKGEG